MVHSLKTPELKALAEALGWEPRELEERIFELGIAVCPQKPIASQRLRALIQM